MEKLEKVYNNHFYSSMTDNTLPVTNQTSAEVIVPYIMELFPFAKSVVDVGGAIGVWAKEFMKNGVERVCVIDGPWVEKSQLLISEDKFTVFDLGNGKPYIDMNRYDIACSFECAEHISKDYADMFVENLVNLSDIIIFSAAIPEQGGDHHINEQKQSYWINKFKDRGYVAIDPIRGYIEGNRLVQPFYKQNMLVYVKESIDWPQTIKKYKEIPFVKDIIVEAYKGYKVNYDSEWNNIFTLQKQIIKVIAKKCWRRWID